jgi:hypothetical protein
VKLIVFTTLITGIGVVCSASEFEGRIAATITRGGEVTPLLYTAGTNFLRVEVTDTRRPNSVNILDSNSGELVLLFPNNRSFVRLKGEEKSPAPPQVPPTTPAAPAGQIGPTNLPGMPDMPQVPQMQPGAGPQNAAGVPPMPGMPGMPPAGGMPMMPMPRPMMEKMELVATGDKTNLLGFGCERFLIKQRGEVMEIWATHGLLPFQPYKYKTSCPVLARG